jgi:glycosyltransferase involved in cell wall biosynthesis
MPVYNEGEGVVPYLEQLLENVAGPCEILVVHDMPEDTTVPVLSRYDATIVKPTLNTYGRGPANAIRFGLDAASGDVTVVTMADGSDDSTQINRMADLVRGGHVIVAASRYMKGGSQKGGPRIKGAISNIAGVSLFHLARVGTHDATNSFKAYSTDFIRNTEVESTAGFEVALELVAKARRGRQPVTEVPTTWLDRTEGESRFDVLGWLPKYIHWYLYAFGPKLRTTATTSAEAS